MNRQIRIALFLAAIGLGFALPAQAVQPNINPSTVSLWLYPPVGAYKDTTFIFASGDSAGWSPGFVFDSYDLISFTKSVTVRLVGKSTLMSAATRSKIPAGTYGAGHPVFDSINWTLPVASTDSQHIEGLRGFKFYSTQNADTLLVRCWVKD